MTNAAAADRPPPKKGGLLERTLTGLLMKLATVTAVHQLSEDFRFIDLEGEGLRGARWSPGDKVQVKMDGGMANRTYTPVQWDAANGGVRFLGYTHGEGPGARWVRDTGPGEQRYLFGPRSSLNLAAVGPSALLFGDETSFAVALNLEHSRSEDQSHRYVFEVTDARQAEPVLEQIGLSQAVVVERRADDAHHPALVEAVRASAGAVSTFILSGKAQSIQQVSRALKADGVQTNRLRTKAYWAPGKVGLD